MKAFHDACEGLVIIALLPLLILLGLCRVLGWAFHKLGDVFEKIITHFEQ